eukprot:1101513-Pyramimonas_sp.AAC.1
MLAASLSAHQPRDHMAAAPFLNGHDNGSLKPMSAAASYALGPERWPCSFGWSDGWRLRRLLRHATALA